MSAVAARKAALAAKLAAESANPSPVSTPIATPARSASPELPVQEIGTETPQASSSRAVTPSKRTPKKSTPRRAGRDTGKKDTKTEKVTDQRYYEEVSVGDKRKKGDKRSTRVYEEVVEARSSSVAPAIDQVDDSRSQSEDDEQDVDFSALELLQTITNGRPKKKRRISTDEPRTHSNFTLQQGSNICRIAVDRLSGFEAVARNGNAVCISMRQEEFITFSGMALITPLRNSLSLFSSVIHPATEAQDVSPLRLFAPLTAPLPVIRSHSEGPARKSPLLAALDLPKEMLASGRTLFMMQELSCGIERLGQAVMTLGKVWPEVGSRGAFGLRGAFPLLLSPEHAVYPHATPESWSWALKSLAGEDIEKAENDDADRYAADDEEAFDRSAPLIAIVKGPKRSGKSTFAREAVNRLLNRYENVAYLDCDLGQSEFGPGGTVGLYIVDKPLLGPSYTHPLQPVRSHFVGSLNPRLESAHYIDSIASLLEHYRYELQYPLDRMHDSSSDKITEVVPLVVNTQGWVKGLGADLLDQIEAMIQATHTLAFGANGLDNLDGDESRPFTGEDYEVLPERTLSAGFGRVIQLEAAPTSGLFSRFSPADTRTLSTIAYLHARFSAQGDVVWDFQEPLVGMSPWEIDFDQVIKEVYLSGEGSDGVVPEDLGLSLNGSLVALLARTSDPMDTLERYVGGRALPSSAETHCVGLGLIRAVSPDNAAVQLLTPVPVSMFGRVSVIVKGDLELPLCGSLDWKSGNMTEEGLLGVPWDEVPFLSVKPERGVGMGKRKFRRNIMRKNQAV